MTLHRAANVDDPAALAALLAAIGRAAALLPLAWPLHPRTRARLAAAGLGWPAGVLALPPLPYLDFLGLLARARLVATDSGGVQEEATALDLPCLTLRPGTERPVTLAAGTSRLVAPAGLPAAVAAALDGHWPRARPIPLWDGQAGRAWRRTWRSGWGGEPGAGAAGRGQARPRPRWSCCSRRRIRRTTSGWCGRRARRWPLPAGGCGIWRRVAPPAITPAPVAGVAIETFARRPGWAGRLRALPALARVAAASGAAVIHASEPDAWAAALLAARRCGARVVIDVHEHYPSRLDARLPPPLRPLARAALRLACRLAGRAADAVVVAKDGLAGDFGPASRIIAVRNYAAPIALAAPPARPRPADPGACRRHGPRPRLAGAA